MSGKHKILNRMRIHVLLNPIHILANRTATRTIRMSGQINSPCFLEVVELELPREVTASRAVDEE